MATTETVKDTITIICLLRRAGGTKIDLYGAKYFFKPLDLEDPEAPHVAEIPREHARQLYRLLSIKNGYVQADPTEELPPRPAAPVGQTIAGDRAAGDAAAAPKAPIIIKSGDTEINLVELSKEDLTILAKEQFGIKPHHKWTEETLIAKIVEATRAPAEDE